MKAAGAFQGKGPGVKDVLYSMLTIVHAQAEDDRTLHLTEELQELLKPDRFAHSKNRPQAPGED